MSNIYLGHVIWLLYPKVWGNDMSNEILSKLLCYFKAYMFNERLNPVVLNSDGLIDNIYLSFLLKDLLSYVDHAILIQYILCYLQVKIIRCWVFLPIWGIYFGLHVLLNRKCSNRYLIHLQSVNCALHITSVILIMPFHFTIRRNTH